MKPDRVRLPFAEQVEFLRGKLNLPTERWTDIERGAHDRAFVVAGAMQADLLDDLREAVDKAVSGGSTLADFRRDFVQIVEKRGWAGFTGDDRATQGRTGGRGLAWRTRTIYQTNIAASYAAGRWRQLNDPGLLAARPYWRYVHSDFVANPRPQHQAWGNSGLTLRHDHPFWKTHFPPNGWGCRCTVRAVAAPAGGDATAPPAGWDARDARGRLPGVDTGWDYAPGADTETGFATLVGQKLIKLDAGIGAGMAQALRPVMLAQQADAFAGFVDATLADKVRGKAFVAGALKPEWIVRAEAAGVRPETAEIAVRDQDIRHAFRDTKAHPLNLDWYKDLPRHLDAPDAVLLDTTHKDAPAFLLIFATPVASAKLVVRVNYRTRKAGVLNIVETGRVLDAEALATIRREVGKAYRKIEGSL